MKWNSKKIFSSIALSLILLEGNPLFSEETETRTAYGPFRIYPNTQSENLKKVNAPENTLQENQSTYEAYGPFTIYPDTSAENKKKVEGSQNKNNDPSQEIAAAPQPKSNSSLKNQKTMRTYGPFYSYPASETYESVKAPVHADPIKPLIEARVGYFTFVDSKMRKVFNQGGVDLQVAASYPVWKWLQLYGAGEWLEKKGRALNCPRRTHLWEYTLSLGLKGTASLSSWAQWYLTAGPRYFYMHVHNNSPYVDRSVNHSAIGGFAGTGFNFLPLEHLVIDIFGEYSYGRMNFNGHRKHVYGEDRQVGGYAVGGGLGFAF